MSVPPAAHFSFASGLSLTRRISSLPNQWPSPSLASSEVSFSDSLTVIRSITVFSVFSYILLNRFLLQWTLVAGLCIRLLGVGLMIHSRGAQASVPHVDVGMVTAVILLFAEIGNAIGNAICVSPFSFIGITKSLLHPSFPSPLVLISWSDMDKPNARPISNSSTKPQRNRTRANILFHLLYPRHVPRRKPDSGRHHRW